MGLRAFKTLLSTREKTLSEYERGGSWGGLRSLGEKTRENLQSHVLNVFNVLSCRLTAFKTLLPRGGFSSGATRVLQRVGEGAPPPSSVGGRVLQPEAGRPEGPLEVNEESSSDRRAG
jgi:hypothetical protein